MLIFSLEILKKVFGILFVKKKKCIKKGKNTTLFASIISIMLIQTTIVRLNNIFLSYQLFKPTKRQNFTSAFS